MEEVIKVVWEDWTDREPSTFSLPSYNWGWTEAGGRHWFFVVKWYNRGDTVIGRRRLYSADEVKYTVSEFPRAVEAPEMDIESLEEA